MSKDRLYIFDTTLRDGAQTQGVDFSLDDKEKISLYKGKYGLYFKYKGLNFGLPKTVDSDKITINDIVNIINSKKKS